MVRAPMPGLMGSRARQFLLPVLLTTWGGTLTAFAQESPAPEGDAPTDVTIPSQDPPPAEVPPAGDTEAPPEGPSAAPTQPGAPPDPPPFTPAQQTWLDNYVAEKVAASRKYTLGFDVFTKALYQNDQSNGSVWLGNPHPAGDNYSGNNGTASTLSIRIDGQVASGVTAGGRLETRFGQLWTDWYEGGDLAVDDGGRPSGVNATGESLGMNHAAYAQLRGLYLQWEGDLPVPTLTRFRAGSSGLDQYNAWTIGRSRFIDRDNARGFFLDGLAGPVNYHVARIALPKTFASAGFNSGIADPLVENPFWGRDAAYAAKVGWIPRTDKLSLTWIGTYLRDEEADADDPDSLGSGNVLDARDGVVATIPRYENLNTTLEVVHTPTKTMKGNLLLGLSQSNPDLDLVDNTIDNNQGLSPIPLKDASGYAIKARFDAENLAGTGITVRAEYFNIGEDWVSTFGSRREEDVLLTDGFLDGQTPTLNIANEFIDFTEGFYETIVGWHGGTLKPSMNIGPLALEIEGTIIGYNTNGQGRCTSKEVAGCEDSGGVYPDFLFPDGMTDTDFFTYANTNDRGRDPRSAYRTNQDRFTWLTSAKVALTFGPKDAWRWTLKGRFIRDRDLRDTELADEDDYLGNLLTGWTDVAWQASPKANFSLGLKLDKWDEAHRSGAVVGGVARYPDYDTFKSKVFLEGRYNIAPNAFLSYRAEYLNKDVETSDPALDFSFRHVVRSMAMLYAGF